MSYLVDSHVLLWFLRDDSRLPRRHRHVLSSSAIVHFSPVSVAELAIKFQKGRLPIPLHFFDRIPESGLDELPFRSVHAARLRDLPRHHGDPFDRMLIAQAMEDHLTILTVDRSFADYDVSTV